MIVGIYVPGGVRSRKFLRGGGMYPVGPWEGGLVVVVVVGGGRMRG